MKDFFDESYEFEQVDDNPLSIKYDFVSLGEKSIPKRVMFSNFEMLGLERFFNLGFGNILISENGQETISDMSRENNRHDTNRVLITVFTCALDFLTQNKDAIITFFGNTSAKQRLYKMGINNNFAEVSKYFEIKGGVIENLQITENEEEGKLPVGNINPNGIIYEPYEISQCSKYNFITLELKHDFK